MVDTPAPKDDLAAVIAAGMRLGEPKHIDGGDYAVLGLGEKLVDLEHLRCAPRRARTHLTVHDTDTFSAYFNRFKSDASVIFADRSAFAVTGILDYHHPEEGADWCEHRVTYTAPRSDEWAVWTGNNKKVRSQPDFAQFIEDNVVDIRTPSGADILEISRNLQAKKSVDFASVIRLADGSQEFTYSEVISGASSKGKIAIPERFTLGIPVFRGDPPYEVTARLRYRITDGKLSLWYDLYRHEEIEIAAFGGLVKEISEETEVDIWAGTPQS